MVFNLTDACILGKFDFKYRNPDYDDNTKSMEIKKYIYSICEESYQYHTFKSRLYYAQFCLYYVQFCDSNDQMGKIVILFDFCLACTMVGAAWLIYTAYLSTAIHKVGCSTLPTE